MRRQARRWPPKLTCESRLVLGHCRAQFAADVDIVRAGDVITGAGEWRVTEHSGNCAAVLAHASLGESIRMSAVRSGPGTGNCTAPPESLVEKRIGQPELVRLLPAPVADLSLRVADGATIRSRWAVVDALGATSAVTRPITLTP